MQYFDSYDINAWKSRFQLDVRVDVSIPCVISLHMISMSEGYMRTSLKEFHADFNLAIQSIEPPFYAECVMAAHKTTTAQLYPKANKAVATTQAPIISLNLSAIEAINFKQYVK